MNWEIRTDVCAPPCVKQKLVRTYYCTLLSSLLLMTQRGRMAREVQEGGDRRIHMADSLHYTAETNTLESNYNPKKKKNLFPLSRGKKSLGFRWEIFPLGVLPLSPLPLPIKHSPGAWKLWLSLQGTDCRMSTFLNTIYLAQWRPGAMSLLLRGLTTGAGDKGSRFGNPDR